MTARSLKHTGALALIAALAVANRTSAAQTTWTTLAPKGGGFTIEAPGTPAPATKPGHYVYNADGWAFFVQVDPVSDAVREFVAAVERGPIRQYLNSIRKGLLSRAIERTVSEDDFEGFPSVRISADGEADDKQLFQGKYWLLVTDEHFYILMAIGPRGASTTTADRFLGSFHLVRTTAPPARTSLKGVLAEGLKPAMLAVALMITEEKFRAQIDQTVQTAPAAKRLGSRWNSTNPAWQRARTSITGRMALLAQGYQQAGEMDRTFDAALARVAPGSQADALVTALVTPAGPEILRQQALIEFVSTVMAADPAGPKAGERAWTERMASLTRTFDEGVGSVLPRDAAREKDAAQFFSTPTGAVLRSLWDAVVGRATTQITGAVRLMLFDEREAITREIEAAVATVK